MTEFSKHFALRADAVDASAPSTSKWNGVRDLMAEELGRDPDDVYVATISKPGNVTVRFGQSDAGRDSPVLLAMHTDEASALEKTIESMRRIAAARGAFAAIAARGRDGWVVVAVVAEDDEADAIVLLESFPAAVHLNP